MGEEKREMTKQEMIEKIKILTDENEILKSELERAKKSYIKLNKDFFYFKLSEKNILKERQDLQSELKRMTEEIARLEKENSDIQNSHMKLYNDTKDEIRELKAEIERLREKCGEVPCEECDCEQEEIDLEALIYDLQDRHQQDCIRYNDMRTAFLKTVDELAMLRKHFGVGQ